MKKFKIKNSVLRGIVGIVSFILITAAFIVIVGGITLLSIHFDYGLALWKGMLFVMVCSVIVQTLVYGTHLGNYLFNSFATKQSNKS